MDTGTHSSDMAEQTRTRTWTAFTIRLWLPSIVLISFVQDVHFTIQLAAVGGLRAVISAAASLLVVVLLPTWCLRGQRFVRNAKVYPLLPTGYIILMAILLLVHVDLMWFICAWKPASLFSSSWPMVATFAYVVMLLITIRGTMFVADEQAPWLLDWLEPPTLDGSDPPDAQRVRIPDEAGQDES